MKVKFLWFDLCFINGSSFCQNVIKEPEVPSVMSILWTIRHPINQKVDWIFSISFAIVITHRLRYFIIDRKQQKGV